MCFMSYGSIENLLLVIETKKKIVHLPSIYVTLKKEKKKKYTESNKRWTDAIYFFNGTFALDYGIKVVQLIIEWNIFDMYHFYLF